LTRISRRCKIILKVIYMKNLALLALLFLMLVPLCGFGGSPPEPTVKLGVLVDNFEDGDFNKDPEWWVFDGAQLEAQRNMGKGDFSLKVKGVAREWYVGGMGTFLAKEDQDLSRYTSIEMDIYGSGPDSGIVKIELYEDDNGNWQIEQDPSKAYAPIYDDRVMYEQKVDWDGWRHVSIAISDFKDTNPGVGDDVWNPEPLSGSGGLAQMQFILIATSKNGEVDLYIDNVGFGGGNGADQ